MFPWPSFRFTPIPIEDPDPRAPREELVLLVLPAAAGAPALVPEEAFPTAAALDAQRAEIDAAPQGPDLAPREELVLLAPPAEADAPALVPEEAFPTAAALDALRAEIDAVPQGPDLALREEVAALLGLDPAVAADAALFAATLAALPPPGPEPDPLPGFDPEPWPALDWEAMSRDWGDLSRGWLLG